MMTPTGKSEKNLIKYFTKTKTFQEFKEFQDR